MDVNTTFCYFIQSFSTLISHCSTFIMYFKSNPTGNECLNHIFINLLLYITKYGFWKWRTHTSCPLTLNFTTEPHYLHLNTVSWPVSSIHYLDPLGLTLIISFGSFVAVSLILCLFVYQQIWQPAAPCSPTIRKKYHRYIALGNGKMYWYLYGHHMGLSFLGQ